MRPGVWSYVFGSLGLIAFLATVPLYVSAANMLPPWCLIILALAWLGLLAFAIWLMRMSPAWVLAMPVLSVIALAMVSGVLEFVIVLAIA
ncbi:hypothetical protein [Microbacterium sp. SSM24]|uniref:hypothetical protein n=1 Tax=Microbacterium sp. SSM24 TaxID=2991714 RepID=UPI002225D0F6|nr:hypothetical protein [Microbacterium sp. SSM24]MCW3492734.1 hypothetical protein [Microbacterium sp. SSM24]